MKSAEEHFQTGHLLKCTDEHTHWRETIFLCGLAFSANAYLKEHMQTHTGDKPFSCEICAAAFSSRSSFKIHKQKRSG